MKKIVGFALGLLAMGVTNPVFAAESNFQQTCTQIHYELSQGQPTINAVCRRNDGTWNETQFIIRRVGNSNGQLSLGSGASTFPMSCGATSLTVAADSVTLHAVCKRINGSFLQSSVALPNIQNVNGQLTN